MESSRGWRSTMLQTTVSRSRSFQLSAVADGGKRKSSDTKLNDKKKTKKEHKIGKNAKSKRSLGVLIRDGIWKKGSILNMINKINKERRRSMNATPTRPSNEDQRPGAPEDPKQKQDRAQGRARTG
jgi:hypothetical protein